MEKAPKKWSLGNILFRKSKKDIPQADFSSEEDDRKAGFGANYSKKLQANIKTNKQLVPSFDKNQNSVANPEFHYFKPSQLQQQPYIQQPQIYVNQSNLELINNQLNLEKNRNMLPQYSYSNNNVYQQYQGSSQDEKSSYNSLSSPINKNGSETGSRSSLNKRTRNARNERYYQRIMREDGRPITVYGSVNSIDNQKYQPPLNGVQNRLSASINSSSLCSSEFTLPLSQQTQSLPLPRYRSNPEEDKDDYENIHEVDEPLPPPIPPRDPSRRLSINNSSVSQQPYYFDHVLQKYVVFNTNGKCFSDDKLWKNDNQVYPPSLKADKRIVKQHHDILIPRSRKPLNVNTNLDNECVFSSEDVVDNQCYPIAQSKRSKSAIDFDKLMNNPTKIRSVTRLRNLTNVDPIRYQPVQLQPPSDALQALRKKYSSSEDVNKGNVKTLLRPPTSSANKPGSRKSFNAGDLVVKNGNVSSNLDDAINELELVYNSLVSTKPSSGKLEDYLVKDDVPREKRSDSRSHDVPTPSKFSMMVRNYEEYENEENKTDKEPDIVLDDVFSRNLKHANQLLKPSEPLPFGIPNTRLGPIPPKPSKDYLSAEPLQMRKSMIFAQTQPDLIADDLAVRNLRKDDANYGRRRNLIEVDNNHFMKRNHTLSSLSEHIYNGILKDSAKPSGGKLEDYLHIDPIELHGKRDAKILAVKNDQPQKQREFEESLNALVIESKAISQKLEKDLSRLKLETAAPKPTKTLANLLDYRKSFESGAQKKSTSCSPLLRNSATTSDQTLKPKVSMTSTACSPFKELDIVSSLCDVHNNQETKHQKAAKIGNLIKMFNTNISPEPVNMTTRCKVYIEKPSRKISDISGMFNKSLEVESKPQNRTSGIRKAMSNEENYVTPLKMDSGIVSPISATSSVGKSKSENDVESNINNIKELIEQIKHTEFDKNRTDSAKPDVLRQHELPDYDNIKEDYEMMTDGRLERIAKLDILKPLNVMIPKESSAGENSPENKSITTSSSSLRETSIGSSSRNSAKSNHFDDSAAIYNDAIEFLHEVTEAKATTVEHKSPIESLRNDKHVVSNYTDKINDNSFSASDQKSKCNVMENVSKLELKISTIPIKNLETTEAALKTPSTQSVVLPKAGPSDSESLYNSTEELSMIFGNGEHAIVNVPVQPGNIMEEDFEVEFDKIALDNEFFDEKNLNENFNVALIDLNNDNHHTSNELKNDTKARVISAPAVEFSASSDLNNNNSLTAIDLRKQEKSQNATNRNSHATASNSNDNRFKTGGCEKQDTNSTTTSQLLQAHCILLACVYCIILYLQFIISNFKSN